VARIEYVLLVLVPSFIAQLSKWQDLHDDNKTCMQSSYWELILENGQ
jgi:hypothetical protein